MTLEEDWVRIYEISTYLYLSHDNRVIMKTFHHCPNILFLFPTKPFLHIHTWDFSGCHSWCERLHSHTKNHGPFKSSVLFGNRGLAFIYFKDPFNFFRKTFCSFPALCCFLPSAIASLTTQVCLFSMCSPWTQTLNSTLTFIVNLRMCNWLREFMKINSIDSF